MSLAPGTLLPPREIPAIELGDMRKLAAILADPNPIHLDASAARTAGIGDRPVTQGPAAFGYVLDMLAQLDPGAQVAELDVRLLGNVFAGDRVTAGGRVERVETADVTCSIWVDVVDGDRVLEGSARILVRETD